MQDFKFVRMVHEKEKWSIEINALTTAEHRTYTKYHKHQEDTTLANKYKFKSTEMLFDLQSS